MKIPGPLILCKICALKEERIAMLRRNVDLLKATLARTSHAENLNLATRNRYLVSKADKRDEFLAIASHELKTPLTSMKLATQLYQRTLKKELGDNSKLNHFFDVTLGQLNKLQDLIEKMVDTTQISHGEIKIQTVSLDLTKLLSEIIDRYPNEKITYTPQKEIIGGWDKYRIDQIVTNLITNAIKYGEGSTIEVSLESDEMVVLLKVKDQGKGIAQQDHCKIFERYERVDINTHVGGLGLGLYIVKQIVGAMDGEIWVESDLGKGSTFIVSLPIK